MKSLILTIAFFSLLAFSSCRDKNKLPPITNTLELSEEMMAYFVNYQVGTKWIYQDTIDKNNYDTIELVSKISRDVNSGNGTLSKGFELYYKPKKSKDFRVIVTPGASNTYYVKVDPMVTAAGSIIYENNNGTWTTGVTYYDSISINGKIYYYVIKSNSSSDYHAMFAISKNSGCVFFSRMNGGGILADYKLIKIIWP